MSVPTPSDPLNQKIEECLRLQKCWPWFLCLGIATILVGALAIGYAFIATLTTVVMFGLGVAIWRQWPESSLWVIGLFVGIDLIFNGWSWVMLAMIVKSPARAA